MEKEVQTLQLFYAAALADSAYHYGRHGVMEEVTEVKRKAQQMAAKTQLAQLGIGSLGDAYRRLAALFGCAAWRLDSTETTLTARSESCKLCAIAKKMGSPKPCGPYCINPFAAYAREFGYELKVEKTLWEDDACVFVNRVNGQAGE